MVSLYSSSYSVPTDQSFCYQVSSMLLKTPRVLVGLGINATICHRSSPIPLISRGLFSSMCQYIISIAVLTTHRHGQTLHSFSSSVWSSLIPSIRPMSRHVTMSKSNPFLHKSLLTNPAPPSLQA